MLDLRVSPGSRCGLDHAFTTASRFWCQLRGSRGARLDVEVLCWPRWRWSAPAHSDAASLNRREVARDISSQAQRGEQQPGHQVNRDASWVQPGPLRAPSGRKHARVGANTPTSGGEAAHMWAQTRPRVGRDAHNSGPSWAHEWVWEGPRVGLGGPTKAQEWGRLGPLVGPNRAH